MYLFCGTAQVFGLEKAALVRMAELIPTITDSQHENTMLEHIRKCASPTRVQPHILELSKCLPSIQDVYASFTKLKALCTPDSTRKFVVSIVAFVLWLINNLRCLVD